jgi:polar amino acid transport system substrate-binding protein
MPHWIESSRLGRALHCDLCCLTPSLLPDENGLPTMPHDPNHPDRRRLLLGLGYIFGHLAATEAGATERMLQILTEEWAPYNYTEDGVLKGFSVEIVQGILKRLDETASLAAFPSMRTKLMLDSMPRTMMITMLRTPEREHLYKWIGPLGDGAIYFYQRSDSRLSIANLDDAKKVRLIACRSGGLVLNTLREKGFSNLDSASSDGASIYKKLLLGRCDLGISESPIGVRYVLKKMGYPANALVQTPVQLIGFPLYIACSKDIPDQEIADWQKALDALKASGVFASIQKKYGEP